MADLLAHESGLPPFDQEKEIKAIPPGTGSPTAQRLAFSCLALSRPPAAQPKKEFLYSNAGFSVAGAIAGMSGNRRAITLRRPGLAA